MQVRVFSDLHLEFDTAMGHEFDPGTGDILVLAGDVCLAADIYNPLYQEFFHKCIQGYNRVFYVMGNHESYHGDFNQTYSLLKEGLPEGITLLHNTVHKVDGVNFIGATLWTNMNNLNVETIEQARNGMNDYHLVENFSPEISIDQHLFTREWFNSVIPTLEGPVFVITHHAPSPQSVKGRYVGSEGMYSSDLEQFICNHPNVTHWAHGHIHENNDYMIGNCNVISNPRGYNGSELNPNFDPSLSIEV